MTAMKKRAAGLICLLLALCLGLGGCGKKDYVLDEDTFFLVMTNMQYYPEQYLGADIEFDCFTYDLQDVNGNTYRCGVRKCSSGYGCTCGKDTIIGFLLNYDGTLPEPRNQSEDNGDKAWVHLRGQLDGAEKTTIEIHAYLPDGSVDESKTEQIVFLEFNVESCEEIADATGLQYYVTT